MIRAEGIRKIALLFWSLGMMTLAIDFYSLPLLNWQVSISYIPFVVAFILLIWAEKREFSSRVFLYRLHDVLIYSSWRYLLLFFLWVSIFSPFSASPLASIVYSVNGWISLFVVGVSAQFLFCEHRPNAIYLLTERLGFVFRVYAITLIALFLHVLLPILFSLDSPVIVKKTENLFLYFVMGFPFLLWDFSKSGRRLLPGWLSFCAVLLGVSTILLVGRKFFSLVLFVSALGIMGLYFYKKMKSKPYVLMLILMISGVGFTGVMGAFLKSNEIRAWTLQKVRLELEANLSARILPTLSALKESGFLGKGVANSEVKGLWFKLLSETGIIGTLLFLGFFLSILWQLLNVRKSTKVVVSNVALVTVVVFVGLVGNYVENPYGAYIWVWFAIWGVFAATEKKKDFKK